MPKVSESRVTGLSFYGFRLAINACSDRVIRYPVTAHDSTFAAGFLITTWRCTILNLEALHDFKSRIQNAKVR